MIENVSRFLGNVYETELAKTARRSARTIWNAHRSAFATTRVEAGKVIGRAIDEGQKLAARVKVAKTTATRTTTARRTAPRSTRRAA